MRLAWLTDIHLNFVRRPEVEALAREVLAANPDAVLLGGDIGEADNVCGFLEQLAGMIRRPIFFVLGNHDYYRGSVTAVREEVAALTRRVAGLTYLSGSGVVPLTPRTALVGHDGWGDGGFGNAETSPIELNDFWLIAELRTPDRATRLNVLRRFGLEAGEHFRKVLPEALRDRENLVALTHVPPFREACWHEGRISDDDWLPFFACRAAGEAMLEVMDSHPDRRLTVLCGHTHGGGTCEPRPRVSVLTGGAVYGKPAISAVIDVA
jgi:predicted phosphohydrolase